LTAVCRMVLRGWSPIRITPHTDHPRQKGFISPLPLKHLSLSQSRQGAVRPINTPESTANLLARSAQLVPNIVPVMDKPPSFHLARWLVAQMEYSPSALSDIVSMQVQPNFHSSVREQASHSPISNLAFRFALPHDDSAYSR